MFKKKRVLSFIWLFIAVLLAILTHFAIKVPEEYCINKLMLIVVILNLGINLSLLRFVKITFETAWKSGAIFYLIAINLIVLLAPVVLKK